MVPAAARLLQIKDLKALRVLFCRRYYRHAGPKGPKEMCFSLPFPRQPSADEAPSCNQAL